MKVQIPLRLEVDRDREAVGYVVECRVRTIDQLGNESVPSEPVEIRLPDFHKTHEVR